MDYEIGTNVTYTDKSQDSTYTLRGIVVHVGEETPGENARVLRCAFHGKHVMSLSENDPRLKKATFWEMLTRDFGPSLESIVGF